jgi:hypothetical protein
MQGVLKKHSSFATTHDVVLKFGSISEILFLSNLPPLEKYHAIRLENILKPPGSYVYYFGIS